jgi:cold shock protein
VLNRVVLLKAMASVAQFATDMNCHVQIVTHPAKMEGHRRGPPPLLEDIAGGFCLPSASIAALLLQSLLRRESDVASGTVKWFNGQKGYGFIAPDGGGKDVFVHISAVEKAGLDGLPDGAKVTFDIVPNRGKESAENLRVK